MTSLPDESKLWDRLLGHLVAVDELGRQHAGAQGGIDVFGEHAGVQSADRLQPEGVICS